MASTPPSLRTDLYGEFLTQSGSTKWRVNAIGSITTVNVTPDSDESVLVSVPTMKATLVSSNYSSYNDSYIEINGTLFSSNEYIPVHYVNRITSPVKGTAYNLQCSSPSGGHVFLSPSVFEDIFTNKTERFQSYYITANERIGSTQLSFDIKSSTSSSNYPSSERAGYDCEDFEWAFGSNYRYPGMVPAWPFDPYTSEDEGFYIGGFWLDVPPTATIGDLASNTSDGYYQNATTISVSIADATAYYGGDFVSANASIKFEIGSQSVNIEDIAFLTEDTVVDRSKKYYHLWGNVYRLERYPSSNPHDEGLYEIIDNPSGTLSINLNSTGTFTPKVTLTDSRGQTYVRTFDPITVLPPKQPSANISVNGDTGSTYYSGVTTVTANINNITAYHNGYIDTIYFYIGSDEDHKKYLPNEHTPSYTVGDANIFPNETLSVDIQTTGLFTPTIIISDGHGTTHTYEFNQIQVVDYNVGTVITGINRVFSDEQKPQAVTEDGVADDQGENAEVSVRIEYQDIQKNYLLEPVVTVNGDRYHVTEDTSWEDRTYYKKTFSKPYSYQCSVARSSSSQTAVFIREDIHSHSGTNYGPWPIYIKLYDSNGSETVRYIDTPPTDDRLITVEFTGSSALPGDYANAWCEIGFDESSGCANVEKGGVIQYYYTFKIGDVGEQVEWFFSMSDVTSTPTYTEYDGANGPVDYPNDTPASAKFYDTYDVEWYKSWGQTTGFSDGPINFDISEFEPPVTLYGWVKSQFDVDTSYAIGVTGKTYYKDSSSEATDVLPQAFYLLSARAGGHGLGVGIKPYSDNFLVDMNSYFYRDIMACGMAGMIRMHAGAISQSVVGGIATVTGAPRGWLFCDGSAVSREEYEELFTAIGTTYGAGDGSTTFNLPDLRDRIPIGSSSSYALNSPGGSKHIQAHTHGRNAATTSGSDGGVNGALTHSAHSHYLSGNDKTYNKGSSYMRIRGYGQVSGSHYTTSSSGNHYHNIPDHTHAVSGGDPGDVSGVTTNKTGNANEGNMPPYIGIGFIIATGRPDDIITHEI